MIAELIHLILLESGGGLVVFLKDMALCAKCRIPNNVRAKLFLAETRKAAPGRLAHLFLCGIRSAPFQSDPFAPLCVVVDLGAIGGPAGHVVHFADLCVVLGCIRHS